MARTIGLYGETGSGKTTQLGEAAKARFKKDRKRTRLYRSDSGGSDSIDPLIRLGVIEVEPFKEEDDPWEYATRASEGRTSDGAKLPDDIGLIAFDSAASMGEALLRDCARLSAAGQDIGGRPAPKFIVGKSRGANALKIGTNVDSHYMVVQSFMRDAIWRSTWLAEGERDVIWTFGLHRGENANQDPIIGPSLAGKALTPIIPKWFKYFFLLETLANSGGTAPRHLLYIQPKTDTAGLTTSYGNSRYPLDATTALPTVIEPASISEAIRLIEQGQVEAEESLRKELDL